MQNNIDFEVNKIKILKDDNYVIWLNNFMNKYYTFNSRGTRRKCLEDIDKENIKLIKSFFEVIDDYAKNNFITCNNNELYTSYFFKYNDLFCEIGMMKGKTVFYFCTKAKEKDYSSYINYSNIKINKLSNKREKIEEIKKEFESLVEILYDSNFSLEDINMMTIDVIKRKSLTHLLR